VIFRVDRLQGVCGVEAPSRQNTAGDLVKETTRPVYRMAAVRPARVPCGDLE
jgi:hypothetical protein